MHGVECKKGDEHNSIGSYSRDQVQCVERDNTKSPMDEAREHLCIKATNQSTLFKDGAILIEDGRK